MRLSWGDQVPKGVSVLSEEGILTVIEGLAEKAGFEVAREQSLESELRARTDLVLQTPEGMLLFEVRRKSVNGKSRIDVETRPKNTYRTRHLLLQQDGEGPWELIDDSNLREGDAPRNADDLKNLVQKLFAS